MSNSLNTTAEKAVETVKTKSPATRDVEKFDKHEALEQQISESSYTIFTPGQKIWIVFLVSVSALISPLGATMFYPALNILSDVLHVTPTMTNISITTYMV
jgi:hypothetical protein